MPMMSIPTDAIAPGVAPDNVWAVTFDDADYGAPLVFEVGAPTETMAKAIAIEVADQAYGLPSGAMLDCRIIAVATELE